MTSSSLQPSSSTAEESNNSINNNELLSQHHADYLSLVQISDLHLFDDPNYLYNGINPTKNFQQLLKMIGTDFADTDCLMATGDLLQYPKLESYNRLFSQFDALNVPYIATAGNHDVTLELDSELPFAQRRHLAVSADKRLVNCYKVSSQYWDILCLDTSVAGKVHGHLSTSTLEWLAKTLAISDKYCVIFAHHPMALVNSAWIDQHTLDNSEEFWRVLKPFGDKVKGIFVGHVHQELQLILYGFSMFTCPAVSAQFKSFCDDYTIENLPAGLRWLTLYNNGTLATGIKRIDTM